jgi:hypothetical protein
MRRIYGKASCKSPEHEQGAFPTNLTPSSSSSPKKSPESLKKGNKLSSALKKLQCSSRTGGEFPITGAATTDSEEQDEGFHHFRPSRLRSERNEALHGGESESKTTVSTNVSEEPTASSNIDDHDDDDFADFLAAPSSSSSQKTNTRQQQRHDYPDTSAVFKDGINVGPSKERMSREQLLFPTESVDEIPEEESYDSSEADHTPETPHQYGSPQYGSPCQIFSEDTHDTPIQSNVQQQPPGGSSTNKRASASEVKLDALCSNYFNTPHNQGVNSTAPLGDKITPDTSPVKDEEEDDAHLRRTSDLSPEHKARLQQLADNFVATKLEELPRLDHPPREISDEKKVADPDDSLQLTPDDASVTIGGQEVKAHRLSIGEVNRTKLTTKHYFETSASVSLKADSSFSSVSSFTHVTALEPHMGRSKLASPNVETASAGSMLTPHPFFWRSHPNVTVTSYQPQSSIRRAIPKLKSVPTMDSDTMKILKYSGSEHMHQNMKSPTRSESQKGNSNEYGPYLQPAAVRKLWLDSEPFRLQVNSKWQQPNNGSTSHPQGPPSTRGRRQQPLRAIPAPDKKQWNSFVNFPAVFSRSDGKMKSNMTG